MAKIVYDVWVGIGCKVNFYTKAKLIIYDVGVGIGCKMNFMKTIRGSGTGGIVTDTLSKGAWDQDLECMPEKQKISYEGANHTDKKPKAKPCTWVSGPRGKYP